MDTFEGVTDFSLKLSRDVGHFGEVELTWQATPREATTEDFSPSSGSVVFSEGQIEAFIYIYIIEDDLDEQLEVRYPLIISVSMFLPPKKYYN